MAIQFITIKCPECGAVLSIDNAREVAFCTYCGAKVIIHNENEHIYRNIDEARIREAETNREIKLKQLEMEERNIASKKTLIVVWIIAVAILTFISLIGISFGKEEMGYLCLGIAMNAGIWGGIFIFGKSNEKRKHVEIGKHEVAISEQIFDCYNMNYNSAVMIIKKMGFTNVTAIPLNDLNIYNHKKDEQVASITINGNEEFDVDDVFPKDANIILTYHSRKS